ncbi:MAG: STAS/SEC14 domain-containing protein [Myxococcales bacterium]|nr:STAS/SEC14 domain-containing protein [Myxococcales bacterium]
MGNIGFDFVEPNIVSVTLQGKIDEAQITALVDGFEPLIKDTKVWGFQADMRDIAGATPEARRIAAQRLSGLPKMLVAVVTVGFAQRIIAKLVLTAIQLLKPGHVSVKYFNDMATARDWLRNKLQQE